MARPHRDPPGGFIYHALNRANRRATLFETADDYLALLTVIGETLLLCPMRILEFCIMPNHWHFLLWPERDGQLAAFMHQMTTTHATRWNLSHGCSGTGHVYQGRYKYFPVEGDGHYLDASRYILRNAKRANLVEQAEDWPWGSLYLRQEGGGWSSLLSPLPLTYPSDWLTLVNRPQTEAELAAIRRSVRYNYPYGSPDWAEKMAGAFGFTNPPGRRGRPAKKMA